MVAVGGDPEVGPTPAPDMAEPDAPCWPTAPPAPPPGSAAPASAWTASAATAPARAPARRATSPARPAPARPIADGQDPDNECAQQAASTCGTDGACNGSGACRRYTPPAPSAPRAAAPGPPNSPPAPATPRAPAPRATCAAAPPTCAWATPAPPPAPAPTDCQSGFFCDSGTCRSKRPNGMACTMAVQCASDTCVDGVCCATACSRHLPGLQPGRLGRHLHVDRRRHGSRGRVSGPGGQHLRPRRAAATAGGPASCTPAAPAAAAASCTGSTETAASDLQRRRAAAPAAPPAPAPGFLCSGTTCGTSCTSTAQCQANHKCVRSACAPLKIAGLTVHDTSPAGAAGPVQQNFQIGTGGAHPWIDYPDTYIVSLDTAANFFLGNEWIRVRRAVEEVHRRAAGDHHPERHRRRLPDGRRSLGRQPGRPRLARRLDQRRVQDPGVRERHPARRSRSACSARPARPAA